MAARSCRATASRSTVASTSEAPRSRSRSEAKSRTTCSTWSSPTRTSPRPTTARLARAAVADVARRGKLAARGGGDRPLSEGAPRGALRRPAATARPADSARSPGQPLRRPPAPSAARSCRSRDRGPRRAPGPGPSGAGARGVLRAGAADLRRARRRGRPPSKVFGSSPWAWRRTAPRLRRVDRAAHGRDARRGSHRRGRRAPGRGVSPRPCAPCSRSAIGRPSGCARGEMGRRSGPGRDRDRDHALREAPDDLVPAPGRVPGWFTSPRPPRRRSRGGFGTRDARVRCLTLPRTASKIRGLGRSLCC